MTAAVTGATGFVGRFVVERLIAEGVAVRAWRRPESDLRGLPSAIEWIEGDLDSPEAAEALVAGADMLVHSALDHVPGRYRRGEGEDVPHYLRSNVGGSLALLATARAAGVRRAVVMSSRAVFGAWPVEGRIGDDHPVRPDTIYGAAKAAVEAFVQKLGGRGLADRRAPPDRRLRHGGPARAQQMVRPRGRGARRQGPAGARRQRGTWEGRRRGGVAAADGGAGPRRRAHVQLQRHRRVVARRGAAGAPRRRNRRPAAGAFAAAAEHHGMPRA